METSIQCDVKHLCSQIEVLTQLLNENITTHEEANEIGYQTMKYITKIRTKYGVT